MKKENRQTRALKVTVLAAACALVLSGCASNTEFFDAQNEITGSSWSAQTPDLLKAEEGADREWWKSWNNPELEALLEKADAANTDVLVALASLRSAAALADQATADLFPTLAANGGWSRNHTKGVTTDSWNAGGSAAWSISLAGGNIAAQRAANREALSSAMTLEDTRIAVAAEVAQTYVSLRLAYVKLAIAEETLKNYNSVLEVARWRTEAGVSDATEFDQATSNAESARAAVPQIELSIAQYKNALARLTATNAADIKVEKNAAVPVAPAALAVRVPAETLRHRPDMRSAELSVWAASDRVYEKRAQWFPTLNITGSLGTQAATIGALGASGTGVGALAAALSMPILNWGTQVAATEQALATLDKARATYTATLVSALEQTENALTGISTAQHREAPLEASEAAAKRAADLALQQYEAGLTDIETVLTTQRTLLNAKESTESNRADLATNLISLYRAMGGGWQPPVTERTDKEAK